jgi:hypothetical protein
MNPLQRQHLRQVGASSGGGGGSVLLLSTLIASGLTAGDPLIIAPGTTVQQDVNSPNLASIEIQNGAVLQTLVDGLTLTAGSLMVQPGGTWRLGTASIPIDIDVVINGAYVPLVNTTVNGFTQPTSPNNGLSRGILKMAGGILELHGKTPAVIYTQLANTIVAGVATLPVRVPTAWAAGDPIIIATSDWYNINDVDLRSVAAGGASGTNIPITAGVSTKRWGVKQYPVDTPVAGSSMSLVQNLFTPINSNIPTELDESCRVANLKRGIRITCPQDPDWTNKGHGVQMMWMASNGETNTVHIEGVQIRRAGHRSALGRYGFHAHVNSINPATGAETGDMVGNYVRKCVVWDSETNAFTCHGTNGMEWSDNIAYNVKGHGFFWEDGSEVRNKNYRNMSFACYNPIWDAPYPQAFDLNPWLRGYTMPGTFVNMSGNGTTVTVNWTGHGLYSGQVISASNSTVSGYDTFRAPVTVISANQFTYPATGTGAVSGTAWRYGNSQLKVHNCAPTGHWITNLNNDIQDIFANDCKSRAAFHINYGGNAGSGAWLSLSDRNSGLSHLVPGNPQTTPILVFDGAVLCGNQFRGMMLANPNKDEMGNTDGTSVALVGTYIGGAKYSPPVGILSTGHVIYKNGAGAYLNSVNITDYRKWTTSDNGEGDFIGSTNPIGSSKWHLLIGTSLNNDNPVSPYQFYPRAAITPYHGTLYFTECTAVNFPFSPVIYSSDGDRGAGGGFSQGGCDSYDVPGIDLTTAQNVNIQLLGSCYGDIPAPIHLDGRSTDTAGLQRHYSIAGAYWDIEGKYGTPGKWCLPFSRNSSGVRTAVDDFLIFGATNIANGVSGGTTVCKTVDNRYFGVGFSDEIAFHSDTSDAFRTDLVGGSLAGSLTPFKVTRQDSAGATIGTPWLVKRGDTGVQLTIFRHAPLQSGGYFDVSYSDPTITIAKPSSYHYFDICNANLAGDNFMVGLDWSGSVSPRVCMGSVFSAESNTFSSAGDVSAGNSIILTATTSKALVAADANGSKFWHDTSNGKVWVKWLSRNNSGGRFPSVVRGAYSFYTVQQIRIKA